MTKRQPTGNTRTPASKRVAAVGYVKVEGGREQAAISTAHSGCAIEITTASTLLLDQQRQLDNSLDAW
ncbi:hypothetical protein V6N13_003071 [Hibiscus sabdariffa]